MRPLRRSPCHSGVAPSESPYSGSSGSMIEIPRLDTNEIEASTGSAGPSIRILRSIPAGYGGG